MEVKIAQINSVNTLQGGGGGGRIAIYTKTGYSGVSVSVVGGSGYGSPAENGTLVYGFRQEIPWNPSCPPPFSTSTGYNDEETGLPGAALAGIITGSIVGALGLLGCVGFGLICIIRVKKTETKV